MRSVHLSVVELERDGERCPEKAAAVFSPNTCRNHDLAQSMVIGTSAIIDTEIDGAVGMNSGIFNNPFIIWGKYHTCK